MQPAADRIPPVGARRVAPAACDGAPHGAPRRAANLVRAVAVAMPGAVLYGSSSRDFLASAERDDAPDGIVGRNAHGHAIAGDNLDPESAHAAAQLRQDLVPLVALHAVEAAAMDRDHRALHINQIILAQVLSFPIKDCATGRVGIANSALHLPYRFFHACCERCVIAALQ